MCLGLAGVFVAHLPARAGAALLRAERAYAGMLATAAVASLLAIGALALAGYNGRWCRREPGGERDGRSGSAGEDGREGGRRGGGRRFEGRGVMVRTCASRACRCRVVRYRRRGHTCASRRPGAGRRRLGGDGRGHALPLSWSVMRALLAGRLGVDVIALLAMAVRSALGEYLAGAVIALMLAGGNALEAYAAGRARRELTALIERAPRMARRRIRHGWRGGHVEGSSRRRVARPSWRGDADRRRRDRASEP